MDAINERFKEIRIEQNLSQAAYGEQLKLAQGTIAQIEKGVRRVTERTLDDVCRIFGVRKEYILNGEMPKYETIIQEDEFMKAAAQISIENDTELMDFVIKYWKLDDEKKKLLKQFLKM